MLRAIGRSVVLALMLISATLAVVHAGRHAYHACQPNAQVAEWALAWRIGGPAWRDLATFTAAIKQVVPAGSVVAFRAVPAEHVVAWRAAYLLPRYEIIPAGVARLPAAARYAAVLRGAWPDPGLELLLAHPLGNIYRLRVPSQAKPP